MYFSDKYFPPFLSGAGYLFPIDVVPCLYSQGIRNSLVHLEDVFITGIIGSTKCGLQLIDDKRHFANMGYHLPCNLPHRHENYIVIHNVNTQSDMDLLHNLMSNNITMLECDHQ